MVALLLCVAVGGNPNPVLFALERKHGIHVRTGDAPVSVFAEVKFSNITSADAEELRQYSYLLSTELSRYPTSLLRAAGLKQIAIVRNLTLSGFDVGGIGDFKQEILYLDLNASKHNKTFRRHIIHHEFFHLLDQEQNGSAYIADEAWIALNPPGFRYGNGGLTERETNAMEIGSATSSGFLNKYAMSGIEEDRAEVYAAMATPGTWQKASRLVSTDPILAAKASHIRTFVLRLAPEAATSLFARALDSP